MPCEKAPPNAHFSSKWPANVWMGDGGTQRLRRKFPIFTAVAWKLWLCWECENMNMNIGHNQSHKWQTHDPNIGIMCFEFHVVTGMTVRIHKPRLPTSDSLNNFKCFFFLLLLLLLLGDMVICVLCCSTKCQNKKLFSITISFFIIPFLLFMFVSFFYCRRHRTNYSNLATAVILMTVWFSCRARQKKVSTETERHVRQTLHEKQRKAKQIHTHSEWQWHATSPMPWRIRRSLAAASSNRNCNFIFIKPHSANDTRRVTSSSGYTIQNTLSPNNLTVNFFLRFFRWLRLLQQKAKCAGGIIVCSFFHICERQFSTNFSSAANVYNHGDEKNLRQKCVSSFSVSVLFLFNSI